MDLTTAIIPERVGGKQYHFQISNKVPTHKFNFLREEKVEKKTNIHVASHTSHETHTT